MSTSSPRQAFERAQGELRAGEPARAAETCLAALQESADDVDLLTLRGMALLGCRRVGVALEPLARAVELAPHFVPARESLAQALLMSGRPTEAVDQLQRAAVLAPESESVRLRLAHALAASGEGAEADSVYAQAFGLAPDRGRLAEAGEHLRAGRPGEAAAICQELLARNPDDVNALRLLARVAGEKERWGRAEFLLGRVLELAPGFHDARLDLARVYKHQDRVDDALACTAETLRRSPHNAYACYLHASMLAVARRHDEALAAFRRAIELRAHNPAAWIGMGHLLKTLGRQDEGIAAYRKAIEQRPNFGEVYWSLANLKTFRFTDAEVADIERRLAEEPLDEEARVHFLFTLGKALEDRGEHARSFATYTEACSIQRMRVAYDSLETQLINERIRAVFTPGFIAERAGDRAHAPVPIFIVGLPRSGSTLIEQILASHSQVEGTAELPELGRVIGSLAGRVPGLAYPEVLAHLGRGELAELGEAYLERTRRHRRGLPYFTDKMPNNFPGVGLIHLILPRAIVIDARRHPLDSCYGSFKQHFAHGQPFTYDLEELGEYFIEYRRMMRHWQAVLPGRVLEVRYEDMVRDTDAQVRRLLDHCGLPFEQACLRFWETERPVRTASSEQVRQPIYTDAVDRWRHLRAELAPLAGQLADEIAEWERETPGSE